MKTGKGGGASLEFLAGLELPGVAVIPNRRRPFIAGNWKMNHNAAQTKSFLLAFRSQVADLQHVDVAVCVPYTSLAAAVETLQGARIAVGAQNVHWQPQGACTPISAASCAECSVMSPTTCESSTAEP